MNTNNLDELCMKFEQMHKEEVRKDVLQEAVDGIGVGHSESHTPMTPKRGSADFQQRSLCVLQFVGPRSMGPLWVSEVGMSHKCWWTRRPGSGALTRMWLRTRGPKSCLRCFQPLL